MPPKDRLRLNDLGRTESACFADSHSPRPPPLAPPTPQPVARLCSSASKLLWRGWSFLVLKLYGTGCWVSEKGQWGRDVGRGGHEVCRVSREEEAEMVVVK